ncbi:pentapeptide repeat-containing protein [Streptomyces sp. SD31]|uniref:pentapeptide repeat-containing protein n=1 Tax=Streptomyces sp. SD31 TaxID=3452208 RepID=UPI003F89F02A
MTATGAPPPVLPPVWPHCARGADPDSDPVGCRGRQIEPSGRCLAHLTDADRATFLSTLVPGSNLDHRGTAISQSLLRQLLDALRDPATGQPRVGHADFEKAAFTGNAVFEKVTFTHGALFNEARFVCDAVFEEARFTHGAVFNEARFTGRALFYGATFTGRGLFGETTFVRDASFARATFTGRAGFEAAKFFGEALFERATFTCDARFFGARFTGPAWFGEATFTSGAGFEAVTFTDHARFNNAIFEAAVQLGPLVCLRTLDLSRARFGGPMTLEAAVLRLTCQRTQWESTAALRLRYATVDLSDAVLEYPLRVASRPARLTTRLGAPLAEAELAMNDAGVRMASLQGADAAHLVLHNVDLSACLLSDTVHLDQLRLEGECPLASAPAGLRWRGLFPVRWTARRVLAEEQHWRHSRGLPGWTGAPIGLEVVGPAGLAPVYRQLRKSLEDGKNEPDAADFYYGEMEMRRHDRKRPHAEQLLLTLYWAVSGYGLRATRTLSWLLAAMAATVLVMMLWGLPLDDPKPATTGRLAGQNISLTTDKPDPVNPTGPLRTRLTSERWEKSLRIVVNSVVFRSSGQDLTTSGIYTEMASRLAEPVLLGLAVLAIRGRVKR